MKKLSEYPEEVQLFKKSARRLKVTMNIKSSEAHELLAKAHGYNSYNHFLSEKKQCTNHTK